MEIDQFILKFNTAIVYNLYIDDIFFYRAEIALQTLISIIN